MNFRCLLLLALLLFPVSIRAFICGRSFFNPRPQGFSGGRDMLHALEYYHDACLPYPDGGCRRCGTFSVAGVYEELFQAIHQAEYFFGTDTLVFSGSRVADRDATTEILADYFGLPTDFRSRVRFAPSVRTAMADVRYTGYTRLGKKRWFAQIDAPIVWTQWDLGLTECCCADDCSPGTLNYPAGYMGTNLIERSMMPCNVSQAFKGEIAFGDFQPLRYGKIKGKQEKLALADINLMVGVCVVDAVDHFFALHARVVAPTGNRSRACVLFEPIVGNGGRWEFGGGLSGYAKLWEHVDGTHVFHLYGEGTVTHLFQAWQKRSYDFKLNGPSSRYVLIEEIGTPIVRGLAIDGEPAPAQYHGKIMPAINQTTLDSLISIGAQADISLKLVYVRHQACSVELGYTLWARSEENLSKRACFPANSFAIKGDAQVYGFDFIDESLFVGLNATQHAATLYAAQGDGSASGQFTNPNADDAGVATFRTDPLSQTTVAGSVNTGVTTIADVNGSAPPVFIRDCDIDDLSGLHPLAMSNALWVNMYHRFRLHERAEPFVGCGGKVEVDGTSEKRRSAQSLWSVWLEGGVSF